MADVTSGETLTMIGSALAVLANIAQGIWANRKGKRRDPHLKKIADCTEHTDKAIEALGGRFDRIEARLERLERTQRKGGAPLDDTEVGDIP